MKTAQTVWLKNMTALLRGADPHASIIPYDAGTKANPITHPSQIPTSKPELQKFFPRIYMNGGKMVTKCKVVTSIPIKEIKWSIMPQLQNYNYFITPTQLRALRTGKAGYFLFGHPELTHRAEFQTVLNPLINQEYQKSIEFQVMPEVETIVVGTKRVSQRVLMVRGPIQEIQNIRSLFSSLFAEDSQHDIGFLARYTFVTSHPVGACTKSHLQSILKTQQRFHKDIHYYIMYGVAHLDTMFKIFSSVSDSTSNTSSSQSQQPRSDINNNATDVDMEEPTPGPDQQNYSPPQEDPQNQSISQSTHTSQGNATDDMQVPAEAHKENNLPEQSQEFQEMSLRFFLYLCQSKYGTNLFHAVYPSTETNKIYILCSQENMQEALKVLHNLREALATYLSDSDIAQILVQHEGQSSYVKDFPKVTGHYVSYANALVNLVDTCEDNPQSDQPQQPIDLSKDFPPEPSFQQTPRAHTTKRTRTGAQIPHHVTPQQSRLPRNFVKDTTHVELTATVTESIARMKNMETNQENLNTTLEVYGTDISTMSTSISNNSKAIKDIQEAQQAQQQTIESIAETQQKTLTIVNSIAEFNEQFVRPLVQTPEGVRETGP